MLKLSSPSWIRGGRGGVETTQGMRRHGSINAPALRAPPLILEGEMLTRLFLANDFIEFTLMLLSGDSQFLGLCRLFNAIGRDGGTIDVDAPRHAAATRVNEIPGHRC